MENFNSQIYADIPKEKFEFYDRNESIHDTNLVTKPRGYFADAMVRFSRNKSSVAAAYIILAIVLYAILVPVFCENNYTKAANDTTYLQYTKLLPKSKLFAWAGWDGCLDKTVNEGEYYSHVAIATETGMSPIVEVYKDAYLDEANGGTFYDIKLNTYTQNGMIYLNLTKEEYEDIQKWQNENKIQVIYPAVDTSTLKTATLKNNANIWYSCTNKGLPKLDSKGNFVPIYKTKGNDGGYDSLRIAGDDGSYRYALVGGTSDAMSFQVRVFTYTYFQYRYGFEPSFLFGTNEFGQDILTRLAKGARFSLIFAVIVSAINLFLGSIYGAIEGYYGGTIDLVMERISDILADMPFVVVITLFQLHFAQKTGPVVAFLLAYVVTGWIGMASKVRMQFYRYKNQEYILAARTLGAKDRTIMFGHIFPNALGTLITGCVLVIPGVIFGEANMTYLGIVNLDSATRSSVGSMLSAGKALLSTYPHVIFFPALLISLLMISFNLFGNGLRDAFNPSLRGTED